MNYKLMAKRNLFFIIALVLMCVWSAVYARGTYELVSEYKRNLSPVPSNGIYVDGADFAPFIKLGTSVFSGLFWLVMMIFEMIVVTIGNVIVFLLVYLVSARRKKEVLVDDISFSKRVMWILLGVGLVISLIITRFSVVLETVLMYCPVLLFASVFYIVPIKNRFIKQQGELQKMMYADSQNVMYGNSQNTVDGVWQNAVNRDIQNDIQ